MIFIILLSGENEDGHLVVEIMRRCFSPALITNKSWESFHFVGHQIKITEATDCYGAVVWPSVQYYYAPLLLFSALKASSILNCFA